MKSPARQPEFFAAYPLKALRQIDCDEPDSAYLKGLLSPKKEQYAGRLRVVSFSPSTVIIHQLAPIDMDKVTADADLVAGGWFNNYE